MVQTLSSGTTTQSPATASGDTMHGVSVLLGLSLLFGGTPTISATTKFVQTGDCDVGIYMQTVSSRIYIALFIIKRGIGCRHAANPFFI